MKYIKLFESFDKKEFILFHSTNRMWNEPKITGLGFHAGTFQAAIDRLNDEQYFINPSIKKVKLTFSNLLFVSRDYRFHNEITKVTRELFKDGVINKEEKDEFQQKYSPHCTFDNLRNLLENKYNYDGIQYINNIEDKGSYSYIAFNKEQIEVIDSYSIDEGEDIDKLTKDIFKK